MCCKTNINGIVSAGPRNYDSEEICLHCDGAGLLAGKLCGSCNGHGVVLAVHMPDGFAVRSYAPNEQQEHAASILGVAHDSWGASESSFRLRG